MRLQKVSLLMLALLTGSIVAGLAIAASTYKLAYRLQKGQRLKYQTIVKLDQSMEMMGQEMTSTIAGISLMHLDVENVDKDGNVTVVYALDSLRTHIKSQNPPVDSTFRNPDALIGKRTRQVMNARGRKLKSAVVDSVKLAGMAAQIGGQHSSLHLIELPGKGVKTGESWTVSNTDTVQQNDGKLFLTPNHTYTIGADVDTLGYKCVRISYTGTMAIKGDMKNMGMTLFIEGEGPSSGTAYFAAKEGLLVAATNDSDLEMTIALTGQMNMTIPQSTSTRIVVTLVK